MTFGSLRSGRLTCAARRAFVLAALLITHWSAQAEVIRVDVASRTVIAARSGESPTHELITGTYTGVLDPAQRHNAIITDIDLATRGETNQVSYTATFALTRPLDARAATGVLIYDVPNRGNGAAVPDADGHIHLISGWQGDIPSQPGLQTIRVPIARNPDGTPVTGPVLVRFVDVKAGTASVRIQAGIGRAVPRPHPLSLDTSQATLTRRTSDAKRGERMKSADWAFADCTQIPFPGRPDPSSLCLKDGFDPRFAYELVYIAKDPPVLGIGFAAVRDLVAFLRYGKATSLAPNPVEGQVGHAVGVGVSQSGNFLRSFVRLGFNASEDGRIVFDGINPHIAARQLALNLRFASPGGAAAMFEPGSEGVLWWGRHVDSARGRGASSLLDRCAVDATCPKVMETFGSAEIWGLRMSPNLVGIDAKADISLPPTVRRYYFAGVTHGGGPGGFEMDTEALPRVAGCELHANPNPMHFSMRALRRSLIAWVVEGREPPPSRYPLLSEEDLVAPRRSSMGFPVIPGAPSPDNSVNPMLLYDFGPTFRAEDLSGDLSRMPPRMLGTAPTLVPRVDADGNEVSGVLTVHNRVPLGTYLGWNVQTAGYYGGMGCGFQGGYIPFARTRAERLAAGDPRPSLEERYGTHEGFVMRVREAAATLVSEGFLLRDDAASIVAEAERSKVLVAP